MTDAPRWSVWWRAAASGAAIGIAVSLTLDVLFASIAAVFALAAAYLSFAAGKLAESAERKRNERAAGDIQQGPGAEERSDERRRHDEEGE